MIADASDTENRESVAAPERAIATSLVMRGAGPCSKLGPGQSQPVGAGGAV